MIFAVRTVLLEISFSLLPMFSLSRNENHSEGAQSSSKFFCFGRHIVICIRAGKLGEE